MFTLSSRVSQLRRRQKTHQKVDRPERAAATVLLSALTFPLQEQPEQGAGGGDGLVVVVVIVDGQQVSVDVGVAHQQLHVGDAVHVLQEAVELIEAARLRPIQREPTKLCTELGRSRRA